MGKLKKPIDMQKAHLTLVEKQNRRQEEESVVTGNNQLKTPPKWLINDTAKKEWRRLAKQMEAIGILTEVDMAAFAGYCQAYRPNGKRRRSSSPSMAPSSRPHPGIGNKCRRYLSPRLI